MTKDDDFSDLKVLASLLESALEKTEGLSLKALASGMAERFFFASDPNRVETVLTAERLGGRSAEARYIRGSALDHLFVEDVLADYPDWDAKFSRDWLTRFPEPGLRSERLGRTLRNPSSSFLLTEA